jgi:hypothetical protein
MTGGSVDRVEQLRPGRFELHLPALVGWAAVALVSWSWVFLASRPLAELGDAINTAAVVGGLGVLGIGFSVGMAVLGVFQFREAREPVRLLSNIMPSLAFAALWFLA